MQFTVQDASPSSRKDACEVLGHLVCSQLVIKMRTSLEYLYHSDLWNCSQALPVIILPSSC